MRIAHMLVSREKKCYQLAIVFHPIGRVGGICQTFIKYIHFCD